VLDRTKRGFRALVLVITPRILKVRQFQVVQIKGLSLAYAVPERIVMFRMKMALDPALAYRPVIFSWDVYALGIIMFELIIAKTSGYAS
jgi:hypothetical protein